MPKFLSRRDFEFIQRINRELSSDIIETEVILYKLELLSTSTNIYGEATEKVNYIGAEIPAYIVFNKNESISDDSGFGIDQQQNIIFRFVRQILRDRNVYPEIGDIINYDGSFYEIDNVQETQLLAGRPKYSHSIICPAHLTRNSNIQIEPRQI